MFYTLDLTLGHTPFPLPLACNVPRDIRVVVERYSCNKIRRIKYAFYCLESSLQISHCYISNFLFLHIVVSPILWHRALGNPCN